MLPKYTAPERRFLWGSSAPINSLGYPRTDNDVLAITCPIRHASNCPTEAVPGGVAASNWLLDAENRGDSLYFLNLQHQICLLERSIIFCEALHMKHGLPRRFLGCAHRLCVSTRHPSCSRVVSGSFIQGA